MNLVDTRPRSTHTVAGVRAVLDGTLVDDAQITVEDGLIVDIRTGTRIGNDALDGHGAILLPGLVDTHTDGLERERQPRQTAALDSGFALRSFESRLWAAGITTVFHGIGFDDRPGHQRTLEAARELWAAVVDRRRDGRAALDHRVLYRLEARTEGGFDAMRDCVDADDQSDILPLVSYEDHTPGQGQYRDVSRFLDAMGDEPQPDGTSRQERLTRILAESAATEGLAERNRRLVSQLATAGRIRALAHDVVDQAGMQDAFRWGARVAEFPITVEAAAAARRLDLPVVCGGPNALRGQSHSGNVSATELVARGLCTGLASDYLPSSLLGAVWSLARQGVLPFADAVGLVTHGPAAAVGLRDRGRIAVGLRADLVLVADDTPWPRVRAVAGAGCWNGPLDVVGVR